MNKTFTNTRRQWLGLSAAALATFALEVHAEPGWPNKPVNLIVPFQPVEARIPLADPSPRSFQNLLVNHW